MFWLILIIVVIIIVFYIINSQKKFKEEQERKQKAEAEKARKKREQEIFEAKAKKVYMNGLSEIYDDLPEQQLEKIHSLLTVMHYNDYDVGEDGFTKQTCNAYYEAKEELLQIVGHNRWKRLVRNGKIERSDYLNATEDMNYVYRLLHYRR